jgi:Fe-S cluster assembly protein SufD
MQLLDPHVSASIGGIYTLRDRQNHDFTIRADHFEADGTSQQHFKGVLDDQARAVFQGKIYVHRPAQKTDGYQSHHALLLSDKAEACAKPELEIYADDVKCSHGATSGMLDREALFYLQSRGIPADTARALLIESFLNEGLKDVSSETVRAVYAARISAWLAKAGGGSA